MEPQQLASLLGQGGITAALIFVLFKVGMAIVAALKELRDDIKEHTKQDLAAMAEVREDLSALGARIDTALELTPIRGVKQYPRPASSPGGYYGPRKPPREDE